MRAWPRETPLLMLHSGRLHPRWGRFSLLATATGAYRFVDADGGRSRWVGEPPPFTLPRWTHDPLSDLQAVLDADPDAVWLGHLSYDLGRWVEAIPATAKDDRGWPVVQLHRCTHWLLHETDSGRWWRESGAEGGGSRSPLTELGFQISDSRVAISDFGSQISDFRSQNSDFKSPDQGKSTDAARDSHQAKEYQEKVGRAMEYISAGDIFQVNLSHRLSGVFEGNPRDLYARLAGASPPLYGAHLELLRGDEREPRRAVASFSPELFLQVNGDGHIITRPIKGTRPASVAASELEHSQKDAAELHMIVDLLRNDLGRVCRFGSIRVEQPREIETHPTVHHGVATITGQLREEATTAEVLRATFPGGSITGAPKVRAMQIIEELEGVRRGPYCGAVGLFHGREMLLNLAIRTALIEQPDGDGAGRIGYSVGGGIVADSEPEAEWRETLDKAAILMPRRSEAESSGRRAAGKEV